MVALAACFEDPGSHETGLSTSTTETSSEGGSESGTETDDGSETDDADTTTGEAVCGDGLVQEGETCDDGNSSELDTCTTSCTLPEPPELELSFSQVKQFEFSWSSVLGAEFYQLLESPDAGEPFVQIGGDITDESISITMPLHFRANASYMLRACDAAGCLDSASVDVMSNLAEAVGYFKASNTQTLDEFGAHVALSGDGTTLAIGVWGDDSSATGIDGDQADNSAQDAGAVYLFVQSDGVWSQQAYIKASNTDADDLFGWRVALSEDGNTLAVGATTETSNATGIDGDQLNNSAMLAGAVYVFVRNAGTWSQQAYVKGSNTQASDYFGHSVTLSSDGDTLAVGAFGEDSGATGVGGNQFDNTVNTSGAVYVFTRDGATWSQQAYVKAPNPDVEDRFGHVLSLSSNGDTLAVGAFYEDSNSTVIGTGLLNDAAADAGAAYVYVRNSSIWSFQAYIKPSNTETQDWFGWRVALSGDGDTLAVSALYEDSNATIINGDPLDNSANGSGAVYVFERSADVWSQQTYVKASNTTASDWFGDAIALSSEGDILAVSGRREDSNSIGVGGVQPDNSAAEAGAVYVYVRDAEGWAQQAYVKASNTGPGDFFGYSVALSSDGDTMAVGASKEDSVATGIGGVQTDETAADAGAVYLY